MGNVNVHEIQPNESGTEQGQQGAINHDTGLEWHRLKINTILQFCSLRKPTLL